MNVQSNLSDTSEEALEVQLDCLRRMTPQQRIQQMSAWSEKIRRMAFDAIRRRHPDYDENEIRLKFIELTYGERLAKDVRDWQREQSK